MSLQHSNNSTYKQNPQYSQSNSKPEIHKLISSFLDKTLKARKKKSSCCHPNLDEAILKSTPRNLWKPTLPLKPRIKSVSSQQMRIKNNLSLGSFVMCNSRNFSRQDTSAAMPVTFRSSNLHEKMNEYLNQVLLKSNIYQNNKIQQTFALEEIDNCKKNGKNYFVRWMKVSKLKRKQFAKRQFECSIRKNSECLGNSVRIGKRMSFRKQLFPENPYSKI